MTSCGECELGSNYLDADGEYDSNLFVEPPRRDGEFWTEESRMRSWAQVKRRLIRITDVEPVTDVEFVCCFGAHCREENMPLTVFCRGACKMC